MATTIRETILDRVATQLATITTGNGYEQSVSKVYRPSVAVLNITTYPAVVIRDNGDEPRWHLRDAMEHTMSLDIIAYVEKGNDDDRLEALSDLLGDIQKLAMADDTWNSNARRTWISGVTTDLSELKNGYATGIVGIRILYRVTRTNPYATEAI